MKHLRIRPLHVELECGECGVRGNAYVKRVWVETVRRVFGLLEGYDVRPGISPALLPHFCASPLLHTCNTAHVKINSPTG